MTRKLKSELSQLFKLQLNISHLGVNNFYLPSEEKQLTVFDSTVKSSSEIVPSRLDRRLEDVSFEGQMRMLDAAVVNDIYQLQSLFLNSLLS